MNPSRNQEGALVCLRDYEEAARRRLPHAVSEYIGAGAADEVTLRLNCDAYRDILIRPRVLEDVASIDTHVQLLGDDLAFPILLAPTAFQRAVHPQGELATAKGAAEAGAVFVVSSSTTTRLEDIAQVPDGKRWFQLYVQSDRGFVCELARAAVASGCRALCVTVDNPVSGARNRQQRVGFVLPEGVEAPYLRDIGGGMGDLNRYRCAPLKWDDLEWLRSLAADEDVPLLLKGITHPADAMRAVELGVDGLIVSNHGGRNLDTQPSTIAVLPGIADAVAGRVPLLMDGGIRRGTDVLKALALGANAVLIGRPYLHGLAVAGADGVSDIIGILRCELEMAMALTGCPSIARITRSVLAQPEQWRELSPSTQGRGTIDARL